MLKPLLAILLFLPTLTRGVDSQPASYLRVARPSTNAVQLEIALRRFVPANGDGPEVWLSGVAHIGSPDYYKALQKHLDERGLVLYEGVGGFPSTQSTTRAVGLGTQGVEDGDAEGDAGGLRDIQATLAEVLGLAFQLDSIDYGGEHFVNSDMSPDDLERLIGTDGNGSADADEVMGMLSGEASIGAMLKGVLGANPKMRALAKVMLIETMGGLKGDLSQIRSLGPGIAKLMTVLIEDRNRIVMADLRKVLAGPTPPSSIALFYGAGHMDNMERALVGGLGYKAAGEIWLAAFDVDYVEAGLAKADLAMIRALSELQRQLLQPHKVAPAPGDDLQLFDPLWEE